MVISSMAQQAGPLLHSTTCPQHTHSMCSLSWSPSLKPLLTICHVHHSVGQLMSSGPGQGTTEKLPERSTALPPPPGPVNMDGTSCVLQKAEQ